MKTTRILAVTLTAFAAGIVSTHAAVFVVPEAALTIPALNASQVVDFTEVPLNTGLNGLTADGFTFAENQAVSQVGIFGPGNTNHIAQPGAVNNGITAATYKLTITLPGYSSSFGLGFAISDLNPVANALTLTLFDGATNVGSLSYNAVPDPTFAGGFAGIGSTIAFNVVEVTYAPTTLATAIDNVAAVAAAPVTAVPEPGSALVGVLALGLCATRFGRRRA